MDATPLAPGTGILFGQKNSPDSGDSPPSANFLTNNRREDCGTPAENWSCTLKHIAPEPWGGSARK